MSICTEVLLLTVSFLAFKCMSILKRNGSTKVVKIVTSRARILVLGHSQKVLKCKCIIYLTIFIDQTNWYIVMMTKEGSAKIVNFMTPGVLC